MVAGKSPEWLPTGWKERVKVINGRKVKCYVDPLTGSKFYSKPQVSKYLENEKLQMGDLTGGNTSLKLEGSQNLSTSEGVVIERVVPDGLPPGWIKEIKIQKKSNGIRKDPVVIERVVPDGLPPGWIKEIKIQKKSNGIRKDPYYTDPVSGYVFRSVPDASRFLESGDINSCAIKPRKRQELSFLTEETSVRLPSAANMQHSGHHMTKEQHFDGMESILTKRGLEKMQRATVSADGTATSTAEDSLCKAIEECSETEGGHNPSRSPVSRTEGSKRKLGDRDFAKKGTDQVAVNAMGIISDRKTEIDPSKSKKQEAFSLPLRSSKRLMRAEPDVVINLGLSERALRAAGRNAGKNEAKPLVRSAQRALRAAGRNAGENEAKPLVRSAQRALRAAGRNAGENEAKPLVRSAHRLLETFSNAEIASHVITGTEAPSNAEQSNRSNKRLRNQTFPEGQPARLVTEEKDEGYIESKILNPGVDAWSDPYLEFAVTTLTGRAVQIGEEAKESNDPTSSPLPVTGGCNRSQCERACAENVTGSAPPTDMVQEGKLAQNGMGKKKSRKMQINSSKSKKKEAVSLPRRSSNRLARLDPNMAVNLPLSQHVLASRKPGESEAAEQSPEALDNVPHSVPQLFETVVGGKKPIEAQAVQGDQPVRQETEKKDEENLEPQFLYPFADSWSDDLCLEFAVKTLTGEIPIEENIEIQDYFQQQDDTSHTLPDLGLPNSFQRDILSDFDSRGNTVPGTQLPENPALRSPGNVDLMGCRDNAPQQPSLGGQEEQPQTRGKS